MKNFRCGVAKLTTTRPTFIAMKVSYAVSLTLIGQVVRRGHQGAEIILPKVYYLTAKLKPSWNGAHCKACGNACKFSKQRNKNNA